MDVPDDHGAVALEEGSHLVCVHPDGITLKPQFQPWPTFGRLIDDDLTPGPDIRRLIGHSCNSPRSVYVHPRSLCGS